MIMPHSDSRGAMCLARYSACYWTVVTHSDFCAICPITQKSESFSWMLPPVAAESLIPCHSFLDPIIALRRTSSYVILYVCYASSSMFFSLHSLVSVLRSPHFSLFTLRSFRSSARHSLQRCGAEQALPQRRSDRVTKQ